MFYWSQNVKYVIVQVTLKTYMTKRGTYTDTGRNSIY